MTESLELDKLRVLLPHWIEHNTEHAAEFRAWAEKVGEEIRAAAEHMDLVNRWLESTLKCLGGDFEQEHRHHHE